MRPAIIIIAFNRPKSLDRLLNSLSRAEYPVNDIPLVISVDYEDSLENKDVVRMADNFAWNFGKKIIVHQQEKMGLRNHVLQCGGYTNEYGCVIMLEDDLFVSPHFYKYTIDCMQFYKEDEKVAGISLYQYKMNPLAKLDFALVHDDYDTYFLQYASSWGQAFTQNQWLRFKNWYNEGQEVTEKDTLHKNIINWPDTSWLKFFQKYLVCSGKYFVYPKVSYTTNFSDPGQHFINKDVQYQVPIAQKLFELNMCSFEKTINVYDVFFEMIEEKVRQVTPCLKSYRFEVDLYGTKDLNKYSTDYFLSSKYSKSIPEKSFGLELKPMMANVNYEIEGKVFSLAEKEFLNNTLDSQRLKIPMLHAYFHKPMSIRYLWRILFYLLVKKYSNFRFFI